MVPIAEKERLPLAMSLLAVAVVGCSGSGNCTKGTPEGMAREIQANPPSRGPLKSRSRL